MKSKESCMQCLVNYLKNTEEVTFKESSEYKLPTRFYKPVDSAVGMIEAYGENTPIGVTGAVKKFVSDNGESTTVGLFSTGVQKTINMDEYYFLYKCDGYDMRFLCKGIEKDESGIRIMGFSTKEVSDAIKQAGVSYKSTESFFRDIDRVYN